MNSNNPHNPNKRLYQLRSRHKKSQGLNHRCEMCYPGKPSNEGTPQVLGQNGSDAFYLSTNVRSQAQGMEMHQIWRDNVWSKDVAPG